MWKEFKAFAFKGNALDLAIGVVIGAAFGKIVTSIVNDLITPIMGIIIGGLDFKKLQLTVGDSSITYGNFIQSVIDFLLIAFSIFLFIKLLGKLRRKEEEKPAEAPSLTKEELLLTEIRDLLKEQQRRGQ
ncbi:large conductance mechanosensitive channel protein MscL [Paenibacillus sp. CAA11]|uniref:large conductance mechanosensitive channel protein MscL n=1 Tax=Paenibacillus sp. CAA11 TaxID=1532905 RepID=UPI000D3D096D|nr:large conductance mechanosensitive channel protein MscL [Paenibacillus sp. CAA11]AWB44902.1 large conductance mechanosensitive channel protein MscL [Paenibacillus sp. CAA11]